MKIRRNDFNDPSFLENERTKKEEIAAVILLHNIVVNAICSTKVRFAILRGTRSTI